MMPARRQAAELNAIQIVTEDLDCDCQEVKPTDTTMPSKPTHNVWRARSAETEAAYMNILESSQTLLHVLKRETMNLSRKKQGSD